MRRLLVVAVLAVMCAAPASAFAADPDVTAQVLGTQLIAKGAVVNVEVEYSCTRLTDAEPPDMALYEETYVDVTLQQVVGGRRQAFGNAVVWFEGDTDCDGAAHTLVVPVPADPTGPAFKSGSAAMTVTAKASYSWYREYEGMGWYPYEFFDRQTTLDWAAYKLSK